MNDMHLSRLYNLRSEMRRQTLSAVLITNPANVFYLSGFAGSRGDAILLITQYDAKILTDSRYTLQVAEQCVGFQILGTSANDISAIGKYLSDKEIYAVGFENCSVSYAFWARFQRELPEIEQIPIDHLITKLRDIKDEEEIRCIQKACDIAVLSLHETIPFIKEGVSERDVALELEYRMRKNGASGASFETIVASGLRGALPHGLASAKLLACGDAVTIDFGALYEGYCSDMTRTFFIGEASPELVKIYHAVLQAQTFAIEHFAVGMKASQVDGIARNILLDNGYGKYFCHALGHGVGIEIHEGISVSRRNDTPIMPGMVFSVEPGVYIEGLGGVRIEDLVLCRENGLEILTRGFKKELAIL